MTGAVRQHLITAGLVTSGATSGSSWVCLAGGLSDHVAAPQVALITTAGLAPLPGHNFKAPARPGLQVLIRGLPNTYAETATKATGIWEALHDAAAGILLLIRGVNNPIWLGYDDQGRPQWSLNFHTIQKRST